MRIDRQPFLGVFYSHFPLIPSTTKMAQRQKNFSVALMAEDADKEMHAVSAASCRERPPSSSHSKTSERRWRLSVLSLPLLPLQRVVDFLPGATETRLLSSALFTASLLSEESKVPQIYWPRRRRFEPDLQAPPLELSRLNI